MTREMTREQAINFLASSGFTQNQINNILIAFEDANDKDVSELVFCAIHQLLLM